MPPTDFTALSRLSTRTLAALAAGLIAALYSGWLRYSNPGIPSDLSSLLWSGQAFLNGLNPYTDVPLRPDWPHRQLYPFTAVLLTLPLALLRYEWLVNGVWAGVGVGWLAWELSRFGIGPRLVALGSPALIMAVQASQWAPLLMAAGLSRYGGWLLACKPPVGLWWLAYRPRHLALAGVAVLVSVAIWPAWMASWMPVLSESPYTVWLLRKPAAWLCLLALIRWREPEARLLVAMLAVPHTTLVYESLPVFLLARSWWQAGLLCAGSLIAVSGHAAMGPYANGAAWSSASGDWLIWCVYLPATIMVCRAYTLPRCRAKPSGDG